MLFRIGINLGEVVVKGNDLLGDGVNVAARLQSIAPPGGILVSSSVYDQITGKLDLGFQDMGEQELKNISRPIRAFSVSGAGQPIRKVALGGEAATRKRRVLVAIGALALFAIAGGVAWQQAWIGPPPPAEVRTAAPDPAKAKLEADLAASEKARAQAELRATALDADAIRARANADAAALRAKAETETASMKAKAQSDVVALRAQAAQEATRSKASDAEAIRARAESDATALKSKAEAEAVALKAKSETEAAAVKAKALVDIAAMQAKADQEAAALKAANEASAAKAATVSTSGNAPSRYDGQWVMSQQCSANQFSPGFSRDADFVVRDGEFTIERGARGQPGYNITRGRPSADGTLVLAGNGLGNQGRGVGQPFEIRLDGRWTGDRYVLRGTWGGRLCDVAVVRK
jgi:hypothetical protein